MFRKNEAAPFIVVRKPEFAPFKGDAAKHGWQVRALLRVIPTLTKRARFQLGVLLQILFRFKKEMEGMGRFTLKVQDANTLKRAGSVTLYRNLDDSDGSRSLRVVVEKERLSAETDE